MVKISLEKEDLSKIKQLITWVEQKLSFLVIIGLTFALGYTVYLIAQKDARYDTLVDSRLKEEQEAVKFWRDSYFMSLNLINKNEDSTGLGSSHR